MSAQQKLSLDPAHVLAKATFNAAEGLGISKDAASRVIGVHRTTITRGGIAPDKKEGELAKHLVRCYRSLYALMGGNEQDIKHWWTSPNLHIGGIPQEVSQSVRGLVRITEYLDAIRGKV
ncbi:MbcA/ParS/Xre antitoxin family protein [Magnetofaba australis]|uniref:Putative XRE family transcriptional regulator n=1 Tax=Magnetofaba australis IT-1 TaxID=1434232 RepID=A0A1Y2KAB1_9PROT|nr:MbcA/ParS/Xre antitoxin family protein [Magnetofaba australis]OSM08773.1 putative XRE family transcriptional regulator [Magnetofaba australis IT-1]